MTRKLYKTAALILTLALLLGAVLIPASAATLGEDMTFGKISEYKDFYEQHKHAVDTVAKGIYDLETQIDIADDHIRTDDLATLYTVVTHTHPELFYAGLVYNYTYYRKNGVDYVYTFNVHWGKTVYDENGNYIIENGMPKEELFTNEQVLAMREEFRARAQWYLDLVDDGMSDFEKALVLHDALALNAYYILQGETYDLLVNGKGKCYGYSEAYAYLLAQVGINSEIVESDDMFHQWNKVEIDGVYYNVDLTHDDPLPDKPGLVEHTYFLLSDAAIAADEINPHYGYTSDFPSDDTRYDGKSYHRFNTQLIPAGDRYYAVDNTSAGRQLLLYDVASDETETVRSFANEYWKIKEYPGYVYPDMYMALQEQDGYLYMNTENKVLVYDTVTGEMSEFARNTFEKSFYGLRVTDGKVYAALAESPNETGALEAVGDCLTRVEPLHDHIVAGSSAEIFGTQWDASNDDNLMYKDGGVYTKTYSVTKAYPDVRIMVVKDSAEWFGDETGGAVAFSLTGAGTFTVTFDPNTRIASVSGDIVGQAVAIENGDVNGDYSLTIDDATLLQRYLAEFESLTEEQLAYADVNGDGKINVHDVTELQRILAEAA